MEGLSPISPPLLSGHKRTVAFTTPLNYAGRLSHLLQLKGWNPLWCPTIVVQPSRPTKASIQFFLSKKDDDERTTPLEDFSAIAFTSRAGILAFWETLMETEKTPLQAHADNFTFTVSALGKDAELLNEDFLSKLCKKPDRIRVTVPGVATPTGLVESLGLGGGRRVLCPVPLVVDLVEPPVIPGFLSDLALRDWVPVKVHAYETRWAGPRCAERVVSVKRRHRRSEEEEGLDLDLDLDLDAIVFTSTGEVEGLLKSLRELGLDWRMLKERCPGLLVAAHGPVTASGAESLGVTVDLVSSRFHSFEGVVDALALTWNTTT